jgi:hypothetical protein
MKVRQCVCFQSSGNWSRSGRSERILFFRTVTPHEDRAIICHCRLRKALRQHTRKCAKTALVGFMGNSARSNPVTILMAPLRPASVQLLRLQILH